MARRYGFAVLMFLTGLLTVTAQTTPVTLEWKFKQGDKFYLENVTSVKQSIDVAGNKIPMDSVNTTVSSFKVIKADKDGTVLEQKIEASQVKGGKAGPQQQVAEKLVGSVLTITLNKKGEVTKIAGFDELIKKLSEDNEEVGKLLKVILTEDTMKQGIQEAFAFMPDKPVVKGDSWKRKLSMSMGPIGTFVVDQEYTYDGKMKDGEQVGVKGTFTYQPPKGDVGGLPFKVTKGDFKTDEAKGTLIFDPEKGRLVRNEFKAKLKGNLTIAVGDQEAKMELEQETDTKIRILDKWSKDF
jgi:hypothetical protein